MTIREAWDRSKGWRTVIFNVASILLIAFAEIINYLAGFGGWGDIFSPGTAAAIILVVNVINIALRAVTTTRIGKSG